MCVREGETARSQVGDSDRVGFFFALQPLFPPVVYVSDEETSSQTLARGRLRGNGGENNKRFLTAHSVFWEKVYKVYVHSFGFSPAERTERVVRGC